MMPEAWVVWLPLSGRPCLPVLTPPPPHHPTHTITPTHRSTLANAPLPAAAEVSAKFPVPLTPAGWAFGIWGLIFLLEGFGAVYQALEAGYDADGFKARFANATNINWIVSWLAAMGWQFAFVQQVRRSVQRRGACMHAGHAGVGSGGQASQARERQPGGH